MTNQKPVGVYKELLRKCHDKGVSLRSLCKELQIDYISIARWSRTEPECFRKHASLLKLLDKKPSRYKNVLT